MTIAIDLRAMREYIEAHGFSTTWTFNSLDGPQCFVGALDAAWGGRFVSGAGTSHQTIRYLTQFTGSVEAIPLRLGGWNRDDAIAVLEIAESCAIEEGA